MPTVQDVDLNTIWKRFLQVGQSDNTGLTATPTAVEAADGSAAPLLLGTSSVQVSSSPSAATDVVRKTDVDGTGTQLVPDATTTTVGLVELATDGENAASKAVQGNDSRLGNATKLLGRAITTDAPADNQIYVYDTGTAMWVLQTLGAGAGDMAKATYDPDDDGVIAEAQGGTNQSSYTLGDVLYASAANTLATLAGNATTTRQFLRQVGDGAASAAPAWDTLQAGDLPSHASTHATGQSDPLAPADIGAAADNDSRFPTSDEKAALTGTGTPGVANVFVTDDDSRLTDARTPTTHASSHQSGGADALNVGGLSGELADAQPVAVRKNGTPVATRPALNLIEGSNVTLTVTDDAGNGEVDVTIAAAGGGGGGALDDLSDVTLTTPAEGEFLQKSATDWVNASLPAASESAAGVVELATSAETTAGLAVQASDTRLSDARTPTTHASTHATGQSDPLAPADIGAAADNDSRFPTSDEKAALTGTGTPGVANVFVTDDDSRLTDARTPSSHASSHATGQSDPLAPADIGAAAASHTHAASDVTSGQLDRARGGTGEDLSASGGSGHVLKQGADHTISSAALDDADLPATVMHTDVTQTVTEPLTIDTDANENVFVVDGTANSTAHAVHLQSAAGTKVFHISRGTPGGGTYCEFAIEDLGTHEWGAGGASPRDTRLQRSAANTLQVDDNNGGAATLDVVGTVTADGVTIESPSTGVALTLKGNSGAAADAVVVEVYDQDSGNVVCRIRRDGTIQAKAFELI